LHQSAGFLRIAGTDNPLDMTAIHPIQVPLVASMASQAGLAVPDLIGNKEALRKLDVQALITEEFPRPAVLEVIRELEHPARDPRTRFKHASFRSDLKGPADLTAGMEVEGRVTNVTEFGAFVDIGVHQDGLVHISQVADRFVKTVTEVLKVGDVVKVRILEVDRSRKRISLTMRKPVTQEALGRPVTLGERLDREKKVGGRSRGPMRAEPVQLSRAARPPESRRGNTRRGPPPPQGKESGTSFEALQSGGRGPRGRGRGDHGGHGGHGGDPKVYTVESEKPLAEARGKKGELKSLAGLKGLLGIGAEPEEPPVQPPAPAPEPALEPRSDDTPPASYDSSSEPAESEASAEADGSSDHQRGYGEGVL
jgi:uncharacterized protein